MPENGEPQADYNRERMIPAGVRSYECHRYYVGRGGEIDVQRAALSLRGGMTGPMGVPRSPTDREMRLVRAITNHAFGLGMRVPYAMVYSDLDDFPHMPDGHHWFIDEFDPVTGAMRRFTVTKDHRMLEGYAARREDIADVSVAFPQPVRDLPPPVPPYEALSDSSFPVRNYRAIRVISRAGVPSGIVHDGTPRLVLPEGFDADRTNRAYELARSVEEFHPTGIPLQTRMEELMTFDVAPDGYCWFFDRTDVQAPDGRTDRTVLMKDSGRAVGYTLVAQEMVHGGDVQDAWRIVRQRVNAALET